MLDLMWIATALISLPLSYILVMEIYLRVKKKTLKVFEFDNTLAWDRSNTRGWKNKSDHSFIYKHKYLAHQNKVHFTKAGFRGQKEPSKTRTGDAVRIILCGGTTSVGYELDDNELISTQIENKIKDAGFNVEVYNASCRNYSTDQLYTWYKEELCDYKPDLVIYYFNNNHPRRNTSIYEARWPMTKPIYITNSGENLVLRRFDRKINSTDDWYVLDENNEPKYIEAKKSWKNRIYRILDEYSMIYTYERDIGHPDWLKLKSKIRFGTDFEQTSKGNDREEKNVCNLPYYWETTAKLIFEWNKLCRNNHSLFMICENLIYYNLGDKGNYSYKNPQFHPLGYKLKDIPSRKYLALIAEQCGCFYCDNHELAAERGIECEGLFLHPDYAYPTARLMDVQSGLIKQAIIDVLADKLKR